MSLTVPITNSLAFLFTVLGDWWVDRKVISRGTQFCPKVGWVSFLTSIFYRYLDWDDSVTLWNSALCSKQVMRN